MLQLTGRYICHISDHGKNIFRKGTIGLYYVLTPTDNFEQYEKPNIDKRLATESWF